LRNCSNGDNEADDGGHKAAILFAALEGSARAAASSVSGTKVVAASEGPQSSVSAVDGSGACFESSTGFCLATSVIMQGERPIGGRNKKFFFPLARPARLLMLSVDNVRAVSSVFCRRFCATPGIHSFPGQNCRKPLAR
jgi:hypothetical protein